MIENNGVYGLTKGQFSASADVGSKSKRGEANRMPPIDPVLLGADARRDVRRAQFLGRQGAARSDPEGGAVAHRGFALIDVISPCVTFNDHEGSTKSYLYTRQHEPKATAVRLRPAGRRNHRGHSYEPGPRVTMHSGDAVQFRLCAGRVRSHRPGAVVDYLLERQTQGEVVTGLLYVDEGVRDMHELNGTTARPLVDVPYEDLCPGADELAKLLTRFR